MHSTTRRAGQAPDEQREATKPDLAAVASENRGSSGTGSGRAGARTEHTDLTDSQPVHRKGAWVHGISWQH